MRAKFVISSLVVASMLIVAPAMGKSLRGRTRDASGWGPAFNTSASVNITGPQTNRNKTSSSSGYYRFKRIPTGTFTVTASKPRGAFGIPMRNISGSCTRTIGWLTFFPRCHVYMN